MLDMLDPTFRPSSLLIHPIGGGDRDLERVGSSTHDLLRRRVLVGTGQAGTGQLASILHVPEPPPRSAPSRRKDDASGGPAGDDGPCAGCGSPFSTRYAAPGGPVRLCPPCATLADLGCP